MGSGVRAGAPQAPSGLREQAVLLLPLSPLRSGPDAAAAVVLLYSLPGNQKIYQTLCTFFSFRTTSHAGEK